MPNLPTLVSLCFLTLVGCSDSSGPADGAGDGDGNGDGDPSEFRLETEVVASGLSSPVYVTAPPGDPRLFVVEQAGRVRIVEDGQLLGVPFLDITDRVRSGGERGLLSVAFHPDYASNGFMYASYTDDNGDTRIERYSVTGDASVADPGSSKPILSVDQPFGNHNGGLIVFGPDGKLYIGLGDGGSGGDPQGHGQNTNTLLGALLRIDVDAGDPFAVPADNPFVGDPNGRDEVWAYGLRNPWRFSFDHEAGNLYIADVGQNSWEEVNAVRASDAPLNYGWNAMEGAHCFAVDPCDDLDFILPVLEYGHSDGCSVTGGYVYRGAAIPEIRGHYFYSDFCSGFLRSLRFVGGAVSDQREWDVGDLGRVLSFGEDAAGELYILSADGRVLRLVAGD